MRHDTSRLALALLISLGCDIKIDGGSGSWPRDEDASTGSFITEQGSATDDAPPEGGETGAFPGTAAPCTAESGDTETPVATSSPTHPDDTAESGDTETPVLTSSTTYPGESGDTETPVGETDGEGHSTADPEPGEGCNLGAGGDVGGSQCMLLIDCAGEPKLELKCDQVHCACLEDGVEVGGCDAGGVCLDFANIQEKGQSCCGFPAVEI